MKVNPRMGIVAPPGYVMWSIDYAAQELMIAAYLSKDPVMMGSYTGPATKTKPDGTVYANPYTDLHTIELVA